MFFLINGVNELTHLMNFILIISNNLYERENWQKNIPIEEQKIGKSANERDAECHDWEL